MGLSKKQYCSVHQRFFELKMKPGRDLCEILDYDAYVDEDPSYDGPWMRVASETQSGVNELLNWINHFAKMISDLEVWTQVLNELNDEKARFATNFEIVSPITFMTLSFPAAIRGKLVFTSGRALRDMFKIKKPSGKVIEDHQLTEEQLKRFCIQIDKTSIKRTLTDLIRKLPEIDDEDFRGVTMNYRNRANHQIAPNIEFGQRLIFASLNGDGFEGFSFGIENAIKLESLLIPLKQQQDACCRVYKTFWQVAAELNNSMRVVKE